MTTTSSASACPDPGSWRSWLDHEAGETDLEAHLDQCPGCRSVVSDMRGSAAITSSVLATLAPASLPSAAETAVALDRLAAPRRLHQPAPRPVQSRAPILLAARRVPSAWRVAASGLAAAVALSAVVAFTPGGRTAAASFLSQFRSQEVVAVNVSPQSQADIMKTLNALGNLGRVQLPTTAAKAEAAARGTDARPSLSLAQARQAVGFAIETPDPALLPPGLDKNPDVQVMPASQVRFTFDKAKARAYFQSTGHPEVSLPDKFDGATLVVSIPSAALLRYGAGTSREALVIGEAGELVVDVQGNVSLDELRDFLLGLPGLPQTTVDQLRTIKDWNDTLPIPVPVDKVTWQQATINGDSGLVLNDNSGVGSAEVWHTRSGHLNFVAGSLKAQDLQPISASLKDRSN